MSHVLSFTRGARVVVALTLLAACGRKPVASISPNVDAVATRWNATLATPEAMRGVIQAQGRAWATAIDDGRRTRIDVELTNMVPGGRHPWVLRTGQCGISGAELLRVTDDHMLKVGDDGKASADFTMDSPFQTTGSYLVAVMASNDNPDRVVACGNLAPPTNGAGR
jgi:hypothetical protein